MLVTGAGGFTGGVLANELARRGYRVRALVRAGSRAALLNRAAIEAGQIHLVRGDVRDAETIERATQGVEFVFHLAALFRNAKPRERDYWETNVGGTEHVLAAARHQDVSRVLHCSTIGVHGGVTEIPAHEESVFAPGDIYQRTKLEGERRAQAAIADGQPVTVIRPAGIYGPGDLRFLKLFAMVRSGRFILFGSGETLIHLVFIDDLVEGMIRSVEIPEAKGKTMILAGDRFVSLRELVSLVAQSVGVRPPPWRFPLWPLMTVSAMCEWACRPFGIEPPLHRRRAAFFSKDRAFSIDRAKREIGYAPQVELPSGVGLTADWYRAEGLL